MKLSLKQLRQQITVVRHTQGQPEELNSFISDVFYGACETKPQTSNEWTKERARGCFVHMSKKGTVWQFLDKKKSN